MDKYEKALDIVARHISRTRTSTSPYIHGELVKQLSVIDELVRKTKPCDWHDLRTNPDDLPKREGNNFYSVDVLLYFGDNVHEVGWYNFLQHRWIGRRPHTYEAEVKAWKYIEKFGEE